VALRWRNLFPNALAGGIRYCGDICCASRYDDVGRVLPLLK
jgi:hypothetical protein